MWNQKFPHVFLISPINNKKTMWRHVGSPLCSPPHAPSHGNHVGKEAFMGCPISPRGPRGNHLGIIRDFSCGRFVWVLFLKPQQSHNYTLLHIYQDHNTVSFCTTKQRDNTVHYPTTEHHSTDGTIQLNTSLINIKE